MEDSHHANCNSIIYRRGAIRRTEIEKPLLAAEGFNAKLVQYLPQYHVISNVHVYFFTCTIKHVHGREPKMIFGARNLVHEKL